MVKDILFWSSCKFMGFSYIPLRSLQGVSFQALLEREEKDCMELEPLTPFLMNTGIL